MRDVLLVGAGAWGRNVARNLEAMGRLAAIVDSDPLAREQIGYDLPCGADLAPHLADPRIRAVYIATPAETHAPLAIEALEAGKHVLVEKPMALTPEDGRRMLEAARRAERTLMVGHLLLFHPAVIELKRLVDEGALGRIRYLYSNRLNFGRIRTKESAIWSFAPHDVSIINHLLGERPTSVRAEGEAYLTRNVHDVTLSHLSYASGVQAHIFVSWLHPFKEQMIVVVGERQMAVFSDTAEEKLLLYPHQVDWVHSKPVSRTAPARAVEIESAEPLRRECEHFLTCIAEGRPPLSDGEAGLAVVEVLAAADRSLAQGGARIELSDPAPLPYRAHPSAEIGPTARIGSGTRIWHFCHVMDGAEIGSDCSLGQNVHVARDARLGNNVKVQNNVSIYGGVEIEDDVFLGPSCVFTNVTNPRAQVNRHTLFENTVLRRGATIGANATILCGVTIGRYAFIGAGAVVTRDVPDYALTMGVPARQQGWVGRHGVPLEPAGGDGDGELLRCPESELRYRLGPDGSMRCIDLDEDEALPEAMRIGARAYRSMKPGPP